jgi:hypothetical protein
MLIALCVHQDADNRGALMREFCLQDSVSQDSVSQDSVSCLLSPISCLPDPCISNS